MYKPVAILTVCLFTVLGFSQSAPKYQAASILEVVALHTTVNEGESAPVYKITLQTSSTVYVGLYTPSASTECIKYAAGMSTTVSVGEQSIIFNDMLGRSYEIAIVSRRPAGAGKHKQNGSPVAGSSS